MTMMSTNSNIRIRPASTTDQNFILSLIPRLIEFGPPSWRHIPQMITTDIQVLTSLLNNQSPETAFFYRGGCKWASPGLYSFADWN